MANTNPGSHWYPSSNQVKDPEAVQRTLKQVLDQFYALQDSHAQLQASHDALAAKVPDAKGGPPPGSGPTDTMVCGLKVAPIDSQTLANGAKLTYVKASGHFEFI